MQKKPCNKGKPINAGAIFSTKAEAPHRCYKVINGGKQSDTAKAARL